MRRIPPPFVAALVLGLAATAVWVLWPATGAVVPTEAGPGPVADEPVVPAAPDRSAAETVAAEPVVILEVGVVQRLLDPVGTPPVLRATGAQGWAPVRIVAGPSTARPGGAAVAGRHVVECARDGERLLRVATLQRAGVVDLEIGAARLLRGRVVDADGAPVGGATVWAGQIDTGGARRDTVSDADGRFELEAVPGGDGAFVAATAPGRAAGWVFGPDLADREPTVTLVPETTLEVAASGTDPARGAIVTVAPAARSTGSIGHPWFLRALAPDRLDASGAARIGGLPRGESVVVQIVGGDGRALGEVDLQLDRAAERVAVPFAAAARRVTGIAIDADGRPVAGAEVLAIDPRMVPRPALAALAAVAYPPVRHVAVTGVDGTFEIGVPTAAAELRATAPGHLGAVVADPSPSVTLVLAARAPDAAVGTTVEFDWAELAGAAGIDAASVASAELRGAPGRVLRDGERLVFALDAPVLADVALLVTRTDGSRWRRGLGRRVVQGVALLHP